MERYSREQRIQIIKIHYKNQSNFTDTCREVRALFGHNEAPRQVIMNLIKHFESFGHVGDVKTPTCTGKVKSRKTITTVIERLAENQADHLNDSDSNTNKDRLDALQSAASPIEGSPSLKIGGNNINDSDKATRPDDNKGNNENQLRVNNSISASKATKAKKPSHR